jgi:hypothetical protein
LTVTEVDGAPSGRPITTIKVSNGDLTISGGIATIDTSGGAVTFPLEGSDGSNSAPTYSFSADSDTGMYRVGGGVIGFTVDSVRTMALQSNTLRLDGTSDPQILRCDNAAVDLELRSGGGTYGKIRVGRENQDIDIQPAGTGQVEVENQTTDSDTTFSVRGNGTGDAEINLNNPTKAVSLICDENQKLKVQGGVNTFIFDVSGAATGITWPDGTTQITAAAGGGDSYGALGNPTVMDSTSQKINANQRIGGGTFGGTTAIEYYYGPVAYPFVSPHTGTIADLTVEITSAAAGRSVNIGIYSTDDTTGLPSSLIASANISAASVAQVTQTSFTGTPAVTRGSLYWIAHFSDTNTSGSGSAKARENNPNYNAPSNIPCGLISSQYFGNSLPNSVYFDGETSLPASVTASDCIGISRDLLDVIIGW